MRREANIVASKSVFSWCLWWCNILQGLVNFVLTYLHMNQIICWQTLLVLNFSCLLVYQLMRFNVAAVCFSTGAVSN